MALQNENGNYLKISSLNINSDGTFTCELEQYKDAETRNNFQDYDKKMKVICGDVLAGTDKNSLLTNVYNLIKAQDAFSSMTDV